MGGGRSPPGYGRGRGRSPRPIWPKREKKEEKEEKGREGAKPPTLNGGGRGKKEENGQRGRSPRSLIRPWGHFFLYYAYTLYKNVQNK